MAATLNLLRIKNLALVEDLQWELAPGFTAITGETGAGKSIIIGALKLLLGERADKSLIRTGAEACTVEAIFAGDDFAELNQRLEESGEAVELQVGHRDPFHAGVLQQIVGAGATLEPRAQNQHAHGALASGLR